MVQPAKLFTDVSGKTKKVKIGKKDVLLASFPRSGSMWVRNVLLNLMLAEKGGNLQTQVEFNTVEKVIPYDRACAAFKIKPTKNCSFPKIIKTHDSYAGHKRAIYILRDPRDTLVSSFYFEKYRLKKVDGRVRVGPYAKREINRWCRHVKSWKNKCGAVVVYEKLHGDPKQEVKKILDYLEIKISPKIVARAIQRSGFSNLKKMELAYLQKIDPEEPGEECLIMRKGEIGQWKNELSRADLEFITSRINFHQLGDFLASLGYKF